MATFEPIDFAYLPYLKPDNISQVQVQQVTNNGGGHHKKKSSSASASADTTIMTPIPPHVAELPPAIQASYIRNTAGFLSSFSSACQKWMDKVPEYAASAKVSTTTPTAAAPNSSSSSPSSTADSAASSSADNNTASGRPRRGQRGANKSGAK
jgi:hypothetical protein